MTYSDAQKLAKVGERTTIEAKEINPDISSRTVETQTDIDTGKGMQTDDAPNHNPNNDRMMILLKTTTNAMLWIVKGMAPNRKKSQKNSQMY